MGRTAEDRAALLRPRVALAGAAALGLVTLCCQQVRDRPADRPAPPRVATAPGLGARAFRHVAKVVSFGARHPGSPGWRQQLDYIAAELTALGLEPRRDRWRDEAEGIELENIAATIAGARRDRIVIGCHHDTKVTHGHPDEDHNFAFVGANDGGSGVGLLLALAAELAERPLQATVEVVFFDGEESVPFRWDHDRALFGSRRFVAGYTGRLLRGDDEPPIRAFVLLDMVGAVDLQIDDETNSDRRLHEIFARAAAACGHAGVFFEHAHAVKDDHLPFLAAGIPSIDLIDLWDNPEWHTPDDVLDRVCAESLQVVGEVVLAALPEIERAFVQSRGGLRLPERR